MGDTSKNASNLWPGDKRALLAQLLQKKVNGPKVFPLSFAQERLWFLDQFQPGSPIYNIPIAVGLPGLLNLDALHRAFNEIIRRHEVLRTCFATRHGHPVQLISQALSLDIPSFDLRRLSPPDRQAELSRLANLEAQRPFDLRRPPLLRASLLRLADRDHLVLLTMHHIISDGWSMGIFLKELSVLYQAFALRRPSPLPDLPIQYADFALWQRQSLEGNTLDSLLRYWKAQLAGAPAVLDLPTDFPRPAAQSFKGATHLFALPSGLTAGVKQLSQQSGATLFMTLLAAFKVLLYRYSGQSDLVVGTPIANRNRAEIEGLIGFFVNTLVLRTRVGGEARFRELLEQVRGVTLGAYEHQDLPFEKLVEELQPERHLNHNPIFQVLFSLQNTPTLERLTEAATSESAPQVGTGTAKFDLALFTAETDTGLLCGLEYNTDLFKASTIERMAGHYQRLIECIVADPDQRLSELDMLTSGEYGQLLDEWNATRGPRPDFASVVEWFEAQAAQRPQAVAVKMGGVEVSYAELNRRANQLAHYLRRQGVGAEVRVGIGVARSVAMVESVLAVLKAGGAYVPLELGWPAARLAQVVAEGKVAVVISEAGLGEGVKGEEVVEVQLAAAREAIERESEAEAASEVRGENLAYVIYTSGSTGTPKGVAMTHDALINLLGWQVSNSTYGARTLQFASLSFDVSFQEMFSTWCSGGTLVLTTEESRRDPEKLVEVLKEEAIERLFLPPVVLQQLAENLADSKLPAPLKQIITAGEQLQITEPVARLFSRSAHCALHNHYGPSESHVVTAFVLTGSADTWPPAPPIGRPIANTQIYLLDSDMLPVPIGVPGELYIGGVALARGYLNRPELTAERFIPNPFSGTPGERLYKTGDLARRQPDGDIVFLGRLDHQVKLRGFRIELGEIEIVLRQHPAVQEAVAVIRRDLPENARLVAYVVTRSGSPPSTSELHRFLREKLPDYMLPATFVHLDALPLSANGKIDRLALPTPDGKRPTLEHTFVPPRTPIEETLAKIWTEVLRLERVGVHDNFFELGGHSLLATQVVSRVRQALDMELPLRLLFEAPTIADLAIGLVCSRFDLTETDGLAQILSELEQLSEEEARDRLAAEP